MTVVCLFAFSVIGANAQSTSWGVKAGLNVSSIEGYDWAKYTPGFNAGVFGQFLFSENFGLESGFFYSMLGHKVDAGEQGTVKSVTNRASYLQLPLQLIYKLNAGPDLWIYPAAGIYVGYGLGGTEISDTDKYFDAFERFDLGLDVGINLQYDRVEIGVGWERGLLKVWKEGRNPVTGGQNAYNSNVIVSVGYFFN